MTIERNLTDHTLIIHQASYIHELLQRFGMSDCNRAATPTLAITHEALPS
jgi:hypothetical protein